MGKLILAMNVSLDGYVDGVEGRLNMPPPSAAVFRYWIEAVRGQAAAIYGRRMYETMRCWDDDHAEWDGACREFAGVWRDLPKWVVSRILKAVGPNATLISGDSDIDAQVRDIKARIAGSISVSGPELAGLMTRLGLIDEYQLHLRPFVLGRGQPFFHDARPPLRLVSSERIDDDMVRLVCAPA